MFIAALLTTAKRWKRLKYPGTDGRMNEMCYMYIQWITQPYKRHEIPTQATTWMNLEVFQVCQAKTSQSQKDNYHLKKNPKSKSSDI